MASYDVIKEFGLTDETADEAIAVDPHWVIAVVRFQHPVTYSRSAGESFSGLYADAVRVRGKPLIITDQCIEVSCSATKSSHLSQLSATLLPSEHLNLLAEIMPGDWVFAWMMHGREAQQSVVRKIRDGKPANDWHDGLKFVGRANGPRKQISQDPNGGVRTTRYSLTAVGFWELDATLYYEPHLANRVPTLGLHWARIGANVNKLIRENGQGIGVTQALTFFLDLLMGQGVPVNLSRGNEDPRLRATAGLDAPYSYIVPTPVGQLLGQTEKTKAGGLLAYADILEFVYGVQRYGDLDSATGTPEAQIFNPEGTRTPGSRRYTGTDLMGTFIPTAPQFTNNSVWSILNQYLNSAVNELYTCLRVNADGKVMPTLVARQLPFSSELAPSSIATTRFLDLPRWRLHPILIKRADLGRSGMQRVNFVHVYGDSGRGKPSEMTAQVVRYPPKRDDLDIARNGFNPMMKTVSCAETDILQGGPEKWMALIADIVMGQHMTLSGLTELIGIQAPICPGDNVELDGAVLHIESVSHRCSISADGKKSFTTTLALSYGVAAEPRGGNLGLYAGIYPDELRGLEASVSTDGDDPNEGEAALALDGGRLVVDGTPWSNPGGEEV